MCIRDRIYRDTINASKSYYKDKSGDNIESDNKGQSYESSHLEKNFFFSRKFDNKTFILFANTCSEKLQKYGTYYSNIKDKMNQAKEYMASSFKKINNDEAKYIFFWGLDTPVSYTHLDVYKRQEYTCINFKCINSSYKSNRKIPDSCNYSS